MSARCVKGVPDGGRMASSHRCMNKAKPGSEFCGVHTPKVKPEPSLGGPPVVEAKKVTKVTVTLTWGYDQAPVFTEPHSDRPVMWTTWQATAEAPLEGDWERGLRVGGWGRVQKKDGTPSENKVSTGYYLRLQDIPTPLADLIRSELERAAQ